MILELILSLIIGAAMLALRSYTSPHPATLAPDFLTYQNMSKGRPAPDPFRTRWLLPKLMNGDALKGWYTVGIVGLLLSFPALYLFAETAGASGLWAVVIWGSLPVIDVLWRMRGMIDHVSWPVALLAGTFVLSGHIIPAIIFVALTAMLDPRTVIFVFAWTLNPWVLLGLIPFVAASVMLPKGGPYIHPDVILHPWQSAKKINGPFLLEPKMTLIPWGVCIAGFLNLSVAVIVSLLFGYAKMFRAIDRVRLYMWAAPVLIIATLGIVPEAWLPLAVIVTLMNPWKAVT